MLDGLIVLLNLLGAAAALCLIGMVVRRFSRQTVPRDAALLLGGLGVLGLFNCLSNALQWSHLATAQDTMEDFLQLLEPMLFGNLFYAYFMYLSRRDIEQSEAKYRLLVENQSDMVIRTDAEGRFLFVSPSYCRTFGKSEQDLLGRSFEPLVHPDDLPTTLEQMEQLKTYPHTCYIEQRAKTVNGWRWLFWADKAIVDDQGNIQAIVGVGRDITEMKKVQQDRELLLHVLEMKNKELESIVYAASHDMRTPLVNIRGFAGELQNACTALQQTVRQAGDKTLAEALAPIAEQINESLYFINAGAAKMQALIDGLLEISRIGTASVRIQPLEMNRMLKHIVSSMHYQIQQAGATVTVESLPSCLGDAGLLSRVFTNLLDNALKYRDPDRPPQIRISASRDGNRCIYRVEDNGIGIAPEHRQKIFEIFYRLNARDKADGEGLGLSLVLRILDRLGGTIHVDSEPGKGSTFILSLPAAENEPPTDLS
jgi:PAS domain S-box-containing protein